MIFKQKLFFTYTILLLCSTISFGQIWNTTDSDLNKFQNKYEANLAKKDTVGMINMLINISDIYAHKVAYVKSYDGYWSALILAKKSNNRKQIARIYVSLGWLYGFYKRNDEAIKHFNLAINLSKEISQNTPNTNYDQSNAYYGLTNFYRSNENYPLAQKYLDSAFVVRKNSNKRSFLRYLNIESGYLKAINSTTKESLELLEKTSKKFEKKNSSYMIVINSLFGKIYEKRNNIDKSILYYKKSLDQVKKFHRHLDYELIAYQSLSELYSKQKNFTEAYHYLKKSKDANEQIFGSRSKNNKYLLEIKDKYRIEQDRLEDKIKLQRIHDLEHEEDISILKNILLIVIIISILAYGYVFFRHLKNKHKTEKEILKEKQRLKIEQKNEILELRNNELTQSALRIIEKDDLIQNLKSTLSENNEINIKKIKNILKTAEGTPEGNWQEFEARFTLTNQSFYKNLKNQFPELTTADQRVCALIKLNFSSKHMAQLLNISVESVHSSRYRVRKKLGLQRNDNLEEFIHRF
jgi:tetratricopeptide (TPR) repeat protein/DNA-binding CsgD family transcriptional regulator